MFLHTQIGKVKSLFSAYCVRQSPSTIAALTLLGMGLSSLIYGQSPPQKSPSAKQDVIQLDTQEIRNAGPVRFQNYSNTPAFSSMKKRDTQLGAKLGQAVFDDLQNSDTSLSKSKIAFFGSIRAQRIFNKQKPGLGADILSIGKDAKFGHINRIQRLIVGYLRTQFDFSAKDAQVISRFILYYNAEKHDKLESLKDKYSPSVIAALDPKKVGIALSYKDWSGKTALLLPLRKNIVGPLQTDLNLKEIRETSKNRPLKQQRKLRELEQRKNTKEGQKLKKKAKQLNQKQEQAKQQAKVLKKKQADLKKKQKATKKQLKKLSQKDPNANPKSQAKAIKKVQSTQKELEKEQKKVTTQQKENQKKQKQISKQQQAVAKQAKEVKQNAKELNKPLKLAANQSKKSTDQKPKPKVSKNVVQDKILFMRVVRYSSQAHYQNELWYLDASKDDSLFRSSFTNICSRDFVVIPPAKGVLVIGYKGDFNSNTNHHLFLLDSKNLSKSKESKAHIHWRSPMILRNNHIYAFEQDKDNYYLSRFDFELSTQARSKKPVNPHSDITFYKDKVYLTGKTKQKTATSIHILKLSDLSTIKIISPDRLR